MSRTPARPRLAPPGAPDSQERRNSEFKTSIDRPFDELEAALRSLDAECFGVFTQRDSYFHTARGRLKLRELDGAAELIAYQRDERQTPIESRYTVTPVADAAGRLAELAARHGLRGVVVKTRRLWLLKTTRIHLDTVEGLGRFLEVEVVDPASPAAGAAMLDHLLAALALDRSTAITGSYIDLLGAAGAARPTLPDLLKPGLDLVFVGINPSVYSAERGHYYARPSNRFWPLLNESGLLPDGVRLGPADGPRLLDYGIGLTDIVARATSSAAELAPAEYAEGRLILGEKLLRAAPRAVCFVGKTAYQRYSGARSVPWGRQPEPVGVSAEFVMPSTSGLCNGLQAERHACLAAVRAYLRA